MEDGRPQDYLQWSAWRLRSVFSLDTIALYICVSYMFRLRFLRDHYWQFELSRRNSRCGARSSWGNHVVRRPERFLGPHHGRYFMLYPWRRRRHPREQNRPTFHSDLLQRDPKLRGNECHVCDCPCYALLMQRRWSSRCITPVLVVFSWPWPTWIRLVRQGMFSMALVVYAYQSWYFCYPRWPLIAIFLCAPFVSLGFSVQPLLVSIWALLSLWMPSTLLAA